MGVLNEKRCKKFKIKSFHRETDGFDKYFAIKSSETYIFDINNKWYKINNYLM